MRTLVLMLTELGTPAGPDSHVVQFYETDDELTEAVASFLAEAIRSGGAAIVIAEPWHRAGFAHALAARGISVAAARRDGALIERDAASTLARLTSRQGPEAAAFDTEIGALLRLAHLAHCVRLLPRRMHCRRTRRKIGRASCRERVCSVV